MRSKSTRTWKLVMAKLLVTVLVLLSVLVVPTSKVANAAAAPRLSKSTQNILVGKTYDLNVLNRVKGSTYVWTTSNKKIATVDKNGLVTGKVKGNATITCTVKTTKKTYKLVCKVTVISPAKKFRIRNKVTALNVGQVYDLNRYIAPSYSNDKTTWVSSDKTIAAPDKVGKFTALKEGIVTITGKTIGGPKDSVTIQVVDKEGTVKTQEELIKLLGSGVSVITIKTDAEAEFNIPTGNYSKTKLVVDAPNSDVKNAGQFSIIEIKNIKANSWYENAVGNLLRILAKDSRIVIGEKAKVSIEVSESGAKMRIENNGIVEEITIEKDATLDISGTSTADIPIEINIPNVKITTSVPLNLNCTQKMELVILKGAEKTQVQSSSKETIPTVTGEVKLVVKVGTGSNATEETVTGTPAVVVNNGGGGGTGSTIPDVTVVYYANGYTSYTLAKPYTQLKSITINYKGITYSVTSSMLADLVGFLSNESATTTKWLNTTNTSKTYNSQNVKVTGTAGEKTKTVEFIGGLLGGRSYTATVENSSVTLTSKTTNASFTISRVGDYTLNINSTVTGLTFTPSFQ